MGEKLSLKLDTRTLQGKKVAQLRKDGIVPGVIYGPDMEPINVQIAENVMEKLYRTAGTHSAIHLNVDGKRKIAMIKEVNREPVKGSLQHISFHAVNAKDLITAEVPVKLIGEGESEAERNGLVILQSLDKIEVRALPMDLPDAVEVSVVDLKEAGERITLASAKLPEGVEFVDHDSGHGQQDDEDEEEKHHVTDLQVASVWEPAALQAANEASGGDAEDESEVESENGSEGPDTAGEDGKADSEGKPDDQSKPE